MIRFLIALSFLFPCAAFAQTQPVVTASPVQETVPTPPPVVLELFTSQGCAFCPPADELMGQMVQQQGIIGLSCHVDYFGVRKNNLGKGFCTKRQNDYQRLIGNGPRYTPQLVVNGRSDMIGYEAGKVSAAILKARSQKLTRIVLTPAAEGAYVFSLPETALAGQSLRLWLAVYDSPKSLAMTEGSNFGKTVNYYNVVSRLEDVGEWDGSAIARSINPNFAPGNGGFAILAQSMQTGHIIAAGQVPR